MVPADRHAWEEQRVDQAGSASVHQGHSLLEVQITSRLVSPGPSLSPMSKQLPHMGLEVQLTRPGQVTVLSS